MHEPTGNSQPSVEMDEGRAAFADAIRQGDPQAVASTYTATARLLPPSAELIEGRESIAAFWQAGLDAGVVDVELEALAVQSRDRMAYEIGRYVIQLRPTAGRTVFDRGTYVLVLEKGADGSWRRAVEMFNPGPMPHDDLAFEVLADDPGRRREGRRLVRATGAAPKGGRMASSS